MFPPSLSVSYLRPTFPSLFYLFITFFFSLFRSFVFVSLSRIIFSCIFSNLRRILWFIFILEFLILNIFFSITTSPYLFSPSPTTSSILIIVSTATTPSSLPPDNPSLDSLLNPFLLLLISLDKCQGDQDE